jgi:gliding motility-associated-like protein
VNGTTVLSGSPSSAIALNTTGSTLITTVVTAQDGSTTETYSITVNKTGSSNASLSLLQLTPASPLTFSSTTPGNINYTASVANSVASVTVTATSSDPNATLMVNGATVLSGSPSQAIALSVGNTSISTLVTAQDGVTTETYTITVTRAPSGLGFGNNQNLTISDVEIPSDSLQNDGIVVHQGVSPNGDGINDLLAIDGITAYPDNKLTIIDRNGVMVFETKGYDNSSRIFDGHSSKNGAMQVPGTYFYSLDYTANGQDHHKTGFIILKY